MADAAMVTVTFLAHVGEIVIDYLPISLPLMEFIA
jgi:hypothetical protein